MTKIKSDIVYARAQPAILRLSGHLVKEIAKFVNKTERCLNMWSIKKRTTACFDQLRSVENQLRKQSTIKEDCQESQAKNIEVSSIMVWKYINRKG